MEKLQALSKVIIIPAFALYFCGFICVTGFYAQFGIVTFDVANARFLIAGFNVLWPLALCLYAVWHIDKRFGHSTIFSFGNTPRRYLIYIEAVALPYFVALPMQAYYAATTALHKERDPASVGFLQPFASWDIAGGVLKWWGIGKSDWSYIFGYAFYFVVYSSIIVVPFSLAAMLLSLWLRKRAARKNGVGTTALEPADVVTTSKKTFSPYFEKEFEIFVGNSVVRKLVIVTLDIILASILFALSSFAYSKIRSEIFDTSSLNGAALDLSGLFSWCFGTIFGLLLLLQTRLLLPGPLGSGTVDRILNPYLLTDVVQYVVLPVLLSIFLFGATIFPRIPFAIGGGEPRSVILAFKDHSLWPTPEKAFLIGESSQAVFVVPSLSDNTAAFQINKDSIEAMQILKGVPNQKSIPPQSKKKPSTEIRIAPKHAGSTTTLAK